MAYQIEKTIKTNADKLKDSDKQALEAAVTKVREAAKGDNAAAIKTAVAELEAASHAMSEALYKSAAAAGGEGAPEGASAQAGGSNADDDAIDAEFEVKS